MSRIASASRTVNSVQRMLARAAALALGTSLLVGLGEDVGEPNVSVLVDRTALTTVPPSSTRILVTALDGNRNAPALRTPVTLTCFSTTGELYGELAGPATGVGRSETQAVGDAEFVFGCGATPADVVCQAAVTIDGQEGRGTSPIIRCE